MQYEEKLVLTAAFLGFAIIAIHFSQLAITIASTDCARKCKKSECLASYYRNQSIGILAQHSSLQVHIYNLHVLGESAEQMVLVCLGDLTQFASDQTQWCNHWLCHYTAVLHVTT